MFILQSSKYNAVMLKIVILILPLYASVTF